jgi:molybdate transport system substrate-binding protein
MRSILSIVLLSCFAVVPFERAAGAELLIAAAADLNYPIKEIVAGYQKQTGNSVKLSLGSSGNFYAQIANGAPFDLYFSADIDYPRKLEQAKLTVPGSLFAYAVGRLVVWVPPGSPVDVQKLKEKSLVDPSIKKIAIANPAHAPYGRAAVAALKHYRIYAQVEEKLVYCENISQTAQFAHSGAADLGIIALALALAPAMKAGNYWEIPLEAYPRMEQGAVITKAAEARGNLEPARAFFNWVAGKSGRAVLERYGFILHAPPGQASQRIGWSYRRH